MSGTDPNDYYHDFRLSMLHHFDFTLLDMTMTNLIPYSFPNRPDNLNSTREIE